MMTTSLLSDDHQSLATTKVKETFFTPAKKLQFQSDSRSALMSVDDSYASCVGNECTSKDAMTIGSGLVWLVDGNDDVCLNS